MFQSTPACERATIGLKGEEYTLEVFQSTPACERATTDYLDYESYDQVSIHARV